MILDIVTMDVCMYSRIHLSQLASIVHAYEPHVFILPYMHTITFKVLMHLCYGVLYHRFKDTSSRASVDSRYQQSELAVSPDPSRT